MTIKKYIFYNGIIFLKGIRYACLEFSSIFIAPLISRIAQSGAGTNRCLRSKCLPLPVHFYSPIPDIDELEKRNVWEKVSPLSGIDFQIDQQIEFLTLLGKKFGSECDWPVKEQKPDQFCLDNTSFSFGCAASLFSMIRYFQPAKIIEIGSGNSSFVIQEALAKNFREGGIKGNHIVIDPFINFNVKKFFGKSIRLYEQPVECLDPSFFTQLKQNDILFIDSSHSVKIGSDVNYLILEILPIINSGVIVHFHDINLPFEYQKVYATNPQFRMFWTESYLLQAFLSCNNQYEILLAMYYLMKEHTRLLPQLFPFSNRELPSRISSSFWIRKK